MTVEVLSLRALNRATLERQLLLQRSTMGVRAALEQLVGLQAQLPQNPYVALWSRLRRFQPDELGQLLVNRDAVRIVVMRGTLHLVTGDDCLAIRPLFQPVLDQELARHPEHGPTIRRADLDEVLSFARPLLATPHTGAALRAALRERFPDHDAAALAYACRNLLGLVPDSTPRLVGRSAEISSAAAESWLGRPFDAHPSIDELVLRYLGAFGPASVADVAAWSGLTGLGEVVERLAGRLRPFRDERGRPLVDLPDAPRPDPDTPSPPRFLPEYDNVLLSHARPARASCPTTVADGCSLPARRSRVRCCATVSSTRPGGSTVIALGIRRRS